MNADSNGDVFCPACEECGWFTLHLVAEKVVGRCQNCGHEIAPIGIAELQALVGEQTSDHAPIESVYGIVCRTCVGWLDDEGASEFGIAIPADWPCGVARAAGVSAQPSV